MSLEDVKNAKKSEVTSQLVRMISVGFPIDDTHRVLSAQDPVYTYILNYWMTASVDSYDVPVYDNFGDVTSLEFPDQMSAEMFVNKIHDYICYSVIRSASLNKLIDAAETEEEVETMNISLVSFADFVND